MNNTQELHIGVKALLTQLGVATSYALNRVGNGGNNRSYCLEAGSNVWLLKEYFCHPGDCRDRIGAEFAFLSFCAKQGITQVPRPVVMNRKHGLALHSWIDGIPIIPGDVNERDIADAVHFVQLLAKQSSSNEAKKLPFAADACLGLQDHLSSVEKRYQSLYSACKQNKALNALEFLEQRLSPALVQACEQVRNFAREQNPEQELTPRDQIVSPSDFGYHNALRTKNGVVFLDFEYAGRDDPLKLICDFACQPAIPVPVDAHKKLFDALKTDITMEKYGQNFLDKLLLLHRLKWCCIMLNEYKEIDTLRRAFAIKNQFDIKSAQEKQLVKVNTYFIEHCLI